MALEPDFWNTSNWQDFQTAAGIDGLNMREAARRFGLGLLPFMGEMLSRQGDLARRLSTMFDPANMEGTVERFNRMQQSLASQNAANFGATNPGLGSGAANAGFGLADRTTADFAQRMFSPEGVAAFSGPAMQAWAPFLPMFQQMFGINMTKTPKKSGGGFWDALGGVLGTSGGPLGSWLGSQMFGGGGGMIPGTNVPIGNLTPPGGGNPFWR